MFWWGMCLCLISIMGMVIAREYSISEIVFIMGVIITGYAYAKTPESERNLTINTKKINENIQTFNDILWGKKE